MKILTLKYATTCADKSCGAALPAGSRAKWYGRGRVYGLDCHERADKAPTERKPVGPCWSCSDPNGFFRPKGPASPVLCDACEAKNREGEENERVARRTRFSETTGDYLRDPGEDAEDRWNENSQYGR